MPAWRSPEWAHPLCGTGDLNRPVTSAVVLISRRTQAFDPDLFTNLGIDPTARNPVVVKSTNHFHAAFAPIAREVLYMDPDGPIPRDHRRIPYTRIQRPIWPLDPHPLDGT